MRTMLRTAVGDTGYYVDLCGVAAVAVLSLTVAVGESGFLKDRGAAVTVTAAVFPHAGMTSFKGDLRPTALAAAAVPHARLPAGSHQATPHAGLPMAANDAVIAGTTPASTGAFPHVGFPAAPAGVDARPHARGLAVAQGPAPSLGTAGGAPAPHAPAPAATLVASASHYPGSKFAGGRRPATSDVLVAKASSTPNTTRPGGNAAARWDAALEAAMEELRPRRVARRAEPSRVPDDPMAKRRQPRIWTVRSRYDDLIESIARHHEVEPALVKAIVQAESAFNPDAVSQDGAQGLMQVLPETASRFAVDNLSDPRENLKAGVMYLKHLIGLFDGNITMAVAAYNAGPNKVLRYRGVPPYTETRNYLTKVMGLRTAYADQSQRS